MTSRQVNFIDNPPHLTICCCRCCSVPRNLSFSSWIALASFRVGVGGAPLPPVGPAFNAACARSTYQQRTRRQQSIQCRFPEATRRWCLRVKGIGYERGYREGVVSLYLTIILRHQCSVGSNYKRAIRPGLPSSETGSPIRVPVPCVTCMHLIEDGPVLCNSRHVNPCAQA